MNIFKTLFLALVFNSSVVAQSSDQEDITRFIEMMFKGMAEKDTAKIHSCFKADAELESVGISTNGETKLTTIPLQAFLNSIGGAPKEMVFEERLHSIEIKQDNHLAMVWTPYTFYLNNKLSHCGVNVFTMIKSNGQWLINHIIDTRQTQHCDTK
jgi:hypothetical protein